MDERPLCPACGLHASEQRSGFTTLIAVYPFVDDDGLHHVHDPNGPEQWWACANDHEWNMPSCWCGFGGGLRNS